MDRTRFFSTFAPTSIVSRDYLSNGTLQSTTTTSANARGWSSTMTDESHPQWRKAVARGDIIIGACNRYKQSRDTDTEHTITIGPHPSWGKRVIVGDALGFLESLSQSLDDNNVQDRVWTAEQASLIDAYCKAKESPILGLEVASEVGRTLQMLRRPFKGMSDLLLKTRKYRKFLWKRRSMTIAKANANAWLEYRYGWKPLLLDAGALVEQAYTQINRRDRRVFRAGSVVKNGTSAKTTFLGLVPGITGGEISVTFDKTYRISSGVIAELTSSGPSEEWTRRLGLRVSDFPAVLWETAPYSFVCDWFVNVGPWIRAMTPTPGCQILGSWTTVVYDSKDVTSGTCYKNVATTPATTYRANLGVSIRTSNRFQRFANPSLAKTPVVKSISISPTHAVDALCLSAQVILSKLQALKH